MVTRPSEKSMLTWHYVLHDLPLSSPYYGGVFWGKLVFPKEYPLKPPAIYMHTPSGRFETNTRLCLSMSDFHPESWNPSWRVESILLGLVSFMLDVTEPRTTGGVHAPLTKRRELAEASFESNKKSGEFRELFPEFVDDANKYDCGFFLEGPPTQDALASAVGAQKSQAAPKAGDNAAQPPEGDRPPQGQRRWLIVSLLVVLATCFGMYVIKNIDGMREL